MENTLDRKWYETTSFALHVLAMFLMLCDHLWSTLLPQYTVLTCLGRIAYPIFAFMIAEGYFHTHDFKKYALRMLCFALVTEIPFDLMYNGNAIYPYHQNVMWTFLIALLGMKGIDMVKEKGRLPLTILASAGIVILCIAAGFAGVTDYYGFGVLTVFTFYFFHERKWWCYIGQIILIYWINVEQLGGLYYDVEILGHNFELVQQGLALIALIPIWLYRGRQGYHSKWFQYFCYAFYPVHMLVLVLIGMATI